MVLLSMGLLFFFVERERETKMVGSISVLVVFKDTTLALPAWLYLPNFFLLGPYLLCVALLVTFIS